MPGFDSAAFQKFSSCLKSHGVALPNGPPVQGQGPNPNSSKFREAMNACKQYAPQMPQGQGPPGNQGPPSNSGSGGFPNST
jgi:hypothetical protein